jgi:hypothetical protein
MLYLQGVGKLSANYRRHAPYRPRIVYGGAQPGAFNEVVETDLETPASLPADLEISLGNINLNSQTDI